MKQTIKFSALLLLTLIAEAAIAQQAVEMADNFRAEGKIYVVVAIVLTILLGLIAYLFLLDRKINDLEKRLPDKNQSN